MPRARRAFHPAHGPRDDDESDVGHTTRVRTRGSRERRRPRRRDERTRRSPLSRAGRARAGRIGRRPFLLQRGRWLDTAVHGRQRDGGVLRGPAGVLRRHRLRPRRSGLSRPVLAGDGRRRLRRRRPRHRGRDDGDSTRHRAPPWRAGNLGGDVAGERRWLRVLPLTGRGVPPYELLRRARRRGRPGAVYPLGGRRRHAHLRPASTRTARWSPTGRSSPC